MAEKDLIKRLENDFFAEKRLLRAIYANPDYLDNALINESLFSSESTKNIYIALKNLRTNKVVFSRDALMQEYSIIDLNSNDYIVDVTVNDTDKDVDLTDILMQTQDFKKRRKAVAELKDIQKTIENSPRLTEEQIHSIDERILACRSALSKKAESNMKTWDKVAESYIAEVESRENGKKYWFRNYIMDSLVADGPMPGEIGVLASASGSGKSTVCSNVVNSFVDNYVPCLWFTLEMSEVASMDRFLSKRTGITYRELKNPTEENFEMISGTVRQEMESLKKYNLFRFTDRPDVTLDSIEEEVKKFYSEENINYCVVVLDLLSMVGDFTSFDRGVNTAFGIELAMNKLSSLAKRLNCHVIGTLQLKRDNENQTCDSWEELSKFRPNRADIKNAGAWLERSRYIIASFRRRMYAELFLEKEEYENEPDIIEISVVKQNNGELGESVSALFDGPHFDIIPFEKTQQELEDEQFED